MEFSQPRAPVALSFGSWLLVLEVFAMSDEADEADAMSLEELEGVDLDDSV